MRRFYVPCIEEGGVASAGRNEAEHIARVLRMGLGDRLILFDGSGFDYTAEITSASADKVEFAILDKRESENEPRVRLTLYQAVIKHDHFEYAVQKCTELGVCRIVPFISGRCVKRPKSPESFVERCRRIALEASKQCGRSVVPEICGIADIADIAEAAREGNVLLAYENERGRTLKRALGENMADEVGVVVGPEGGFEEDEAGALISAGARAVSLGKLILRAETAGIAAAAMIMYEYGE